ncbi:lytic transglycosylase domain-containing protein [Pukyongiella litopenaei]|uniref:Lytic transglycosylase domain-containing protein n=1 Tax=Pukyongiella litopenaei TaxID=2605946 RepID=A0A2S0MSK7_9RHOB|nr:lytic transglycosylase domain-containing protein [Pukyongiella litopenaei]AVO38852.1 lytic transglycosylase domain-containing protein [Pukyongiella litopenaei]
MTCQKKPEPRAPHWGRARATIALVAVISCAVALPNDARAATASRDAGLCDRAAIAAARRENVPAEVLMAITRTETGRARPSGFQPWPWTVNMEGIGSWFDSKKQARDHVTAQIRRGAKSFDIGCFQINYRWHGHAFSSIAEMFDPVHNAVYAARFLRELFEEHGDWHRAAGAYHSRTPALANAYAQRFGRVYANLSTGAHDAVPAPRGLLDPVRPLVEAGEHRPGSLVPLGSTPPGAVFIALN